MWDTCAEATTMSDKCASRILCAQINIAVGLQKPLCNFRWMDKPNIFHGFAGGDSQGIEVDVIASFKIGYGDKGDNESFPWLTCRIVPGQNDDLLIGWDDLWKLGFSPCERPGYAKFNL